MLAEKPHPVDPSSRFIRPGAGHVAAWRIAQRFDRSGLGIGQRNHRQCADFREAAGLPADASRPDIEEVFRARHLL
jgi:hypothetical protein